MKTEKFYSIGIDTSNYKTSLALVDNEGSIIKDSRKLLEVKHGERGLRQSEALFQHVNNLPVLFKELFSDLGNEIQNNIRCIAVSTKPRPVDGSYMPVFNAGRSAAETLAAAMCIPCYEFSHQEGHIEAVRHGSPLMKSDKFITFHFSGGTTEAVLVQNGVDMTSEYSIVGGSKDISYGQLLDRVGVALGMAFPSGEKMDAIALSSNRGENVLTEIKCNDGYVNLSGIETQCMKSMKCCNSEDLIAELFEKITASISSMTDQISKKYEINDFLFAGGVSSSSYLREHLNLDLNCYFGDQKLSTDNAVGIALLGGKRYALEANNCLTTK